jgi:hypothetical protein
LISEKHLSSLRERRFNTEAHLLFNRNVQINALSSRNFFELFCCVALASAHVSDKKNAHRTD